MSLLLYGGSYLKARVMERDIVPKPREEFFVLEHAELHCGNLVSQERFSVLWTVADVKVCFGFNLRNICFHLSFGCQSYKFELSYASIWEIQLHRSPAQHSQFLVIQVQAAPRIYKRVPCYSDIFLEDPLTILETYWMNSGIHEGPFNLEMGFLYSRSLDLVPIVEPKHGIEVPYEVLFKVNLMVQHGILMGPTLDDEFFSLVSPRSVPINYIEHALENMSYLKRACFTPSKWLRESYKKFQTLNRNPKSPTISLDSGLVYVRRVRVTPSKLYFNGPEVNVSNRVLHNYSDDLNNFLRVSFVDEDWEKMHSTDLSPRSVSVGDEKHTEICKRILSTLRNGIAIGDKKFEFLAFSSSQLCENSMWMFSSRKGLTAADIRKWMGDFHKIRNVAKYAARLGQSFGSSTETLTIGRDEVEMIPDIKNSEGYIFSDGIGKISADFSKRMAMKCNIKFMTTSAFQIRYGGCKGVVAVDPTSTKKLSLRKSMSKYEPENTKLDVLAYSKYQPCYLNRQLITLLSTLGVGDHIFEMKQQVTVE